MASKQLAGEIWWKDNNGQVNIGFNKPFIDQVLTECYHITQSSMVVMTKGKPMLTVETNEGLKVIRSPVTGVVQMFNNNARDFPDTLTDETVVMTIRKAAVKPVDVKPKEAPKKKFPFDGFYYNPQPLNFDEFLEDNPPV